jgi:ABC-type phosphate transport system auxiliary subunit
MNDIREISSKFERLRVTICRDCFDAEIDDRYVRRVEMSGMSV